MLPPGGWPRADSHGTTPLPDTLATEWGGKRGALFWLALKTGFWSILTLGFYRFWMKTRLRRYFWSAIRPGGHPMEYVGDPVEKLLGFFIAVVILTFYIGLVNLILMFVSFSLFEGAGFGFIATGAGVLPLWFFARYRARRYVLGRTRWRGMRFAVDKAAWAYTGQALKHWAITLLSLGVLWPRMTFYLEKFRIDRTWFGDVQLHQGGRWQMLYPALRPLLVIVALTALWALWVAWLSPVIPPAPDGAETLSIDYFEQIFVTDGAERGFTLQNLTGPWRLVAAPVLILALLYALIHYIAVSKRILANHKTADGLTFHSVIRPARVATIYGIGVTMSYLVLVVGLSLILGIGMATFGPETFVSIFGEDIPGVEAAPRWLKITAMAVLYFLVFLMWSTLYNTFVTFPLWRHYAETTSLGQPGRLATVSQRARDAAEGAEGFAEALDLGAAI